MDSTKLIHDLLDSLDDDVFHFVEDTEVRHAYVPGIYETIALGLMVVYLAGFFNVEEMGKKHRNWLTRVFTSAKNNQTDQELEQELKQQLKEFTEQKQPESISEQDKESARIFVMELLERKGMSTTVAARIATKLEQTYFPEN